MTLTPGTRLGPYEILAAIGSGGMGEVYRARDTRLDHIVKRCLARNPDERWQAASDVMSACGRHRNEHGG